MYRIVACWCLLLPALALGIAEAEESEPKLERGKHYNKTPQEAVEAMTVPDGFEVSLFAGEPDVRQPNAFCIDDRGRLWVAENYTYTKIGWKPDVRDRILIFEDTDGDGRFDKRKVFTEDVTYCSGIEVGYGGVWLGSPPNLLFIPDKDGDDVPDGKAKIIRDGWGAQDQHETLNSFNWGPDGWLYGCHGVFTHSKIGKPGDADKDRQPINAGVWRYHPVKDKFEVFAWGTSNPWGIDWDENGQLFMTACVIPHLWHVAQGGRYHRQAGRHFSPHIYDDIKTISDHSHQNFKGREGGFAHGGASIYRGESFPQKYRNKLFMFNIHHRCIYIDSLKRKGASFEGAHDEDFLFANDPWFIGFSLQYGPHGSMYCIDWYDVKICHGQTPEGKDTGRIFRISYKDTKHSPVNMKAKSSAELAKLMVSKNEWMVRHARRILAERAAADDDIADALELLRGQLTSDKNAVPMRLQALWTLHCCGAADDAMLVKLLGSESEYLRAWSIQLLSEDGQVDEVVRDQFAKLAVADRSQVVRLYLASALQRLPVDQRWEIATGLVGHPEDGTDHLLDLMYWYAIEPLVAADKLQALKLAGAIKNPEQGKGRKLRQFIARRAASN